MKHVLMTLTAPIALAAAATPADAAVFNFNLTGSYAATFGIDTAKLAPPVDFGSTYFVVENVAGTFAGVNRVAQSITFNTQAFDGGLTIQLGSEFVGLLGSPLFSGTTRAPSFTAGTYTLTSDIDDQATSTLTISAASTPAVPEPATWALMIAGFAMVGATMRHRVRVRYAAL